MSIARNIEVANTRQHCSTLKNGGKEVTVGERERRGRERTKREEKKEKGEKERECDVLVQWSIQNECIVCTSTSQRFILLRVELSAMFSGSNTVAVQKRQNVTPVWAAASPKM